MLIILGMYCGCATVKIFTGVNWNAVPVEGNALVEHCLGLLRGSGELFIIRTCNERAVGEQH